MGMSVGILVGLSVSPVVSGIVTSLMSILSAIMLVLTGLTRPDNSASEMERFKGEGADKGKVTFLEVKSLWPVAILMAAILVGSMAGVLIRENDLLGIYPRIALWKWRSAGFNEREALGLYSANISSNETKPVGKSEKSPHISKAGLFSAWLKTTNQTDLLRLKHLEGDSLKSELKSLIGDTNGGFIDGLTEVQRTQLRDSICKSSE